MNLVAHQLLSFHKPNYQIGNLLGEVIKGKNYKDYPVEIAKGILLHRAIDFYTDQNYIVKTSTAKLRKNHGKWAPIIIDVFYDFLLIKNWKTFNNQDYHSFVEDCYLLFKNNEAIFPKQMKPMLDHMYSNDWFRLYSSLDGVASTLRGIGKRTYFANNLENAAKELYLYEKDIEEDFLSFFPTLYNYSKDWIQNREK